MKEMIAYCGLPCHECGAFVAKQDNDDTRRAETAQLWSQRLGIALQRGDINCDGCCADGGTLFLYCRTCEVRGCAEKRGVINCARCAEYVCEKLERLFHVIPRSKERLAAIRKSYEDL